MAQVMAHTVSEDRLTHTLTLDDGNTITVPVSETLPAESGWGQVFEASGQSVSTGTVKPLLEGFEGSAGG